MESTCRYLSKASFDNLWDMQISNRTGRQHEEVPRSHRDSHGNNGRDFWDAHQARRLRFLCTSLMSNDLDVSSATKFEISCCDHWHGFQFQVLTKRAIKVS